MVFMIRLSVIPSHMSTAVFSTCDVKFWHFAISTFFTLPKQLILVYLGVLLLGGKSDFWIKFGLFGVAGAITVFSGVWIWWKMVAIKKELIIKQDALRARRALRRDNSYNNQDAGAYANMAEQDQEQQARVYAASYIGPNPQQAQEKTYQPYNAQPQQPELDHSGDLGTYGGMDSSAPPGMAYSSPDEAYYAAPTIAKYQAGARHSPEQTTAHRPQRFV